MSLIVTFYSFKGGVGRTMALANIATLLVERGLKVLAVDWDLEAPGLERYFTDYEWNSSGEEDGLGLLDLLVEARNSSSVEEWPDWRQYLTTVSLPVGELSTIMAGRRDERYAVELETFDWTTFFDEHDGGEFFEHLREEWLSTFDVTLIDSRTGLTDAGGVCTIQMPDVLVAVFTASYQSLYGVRDAIQMAQDARQNIDYDRMPLTVLPLPSRWDGRAEVDESKEWLERFADTLGHCYDSWLPSEYAYGQMIERTKVPHVALFSFGEKLPALTHGTSDPELPGYAFAAHASLLADKFKDAGRLLGSPSHKPPKRTERVTSKVGYEFDVYISYRRGAPTTQWMETHFLPMFRSFLDMELPYSPNVFQDESSVASGTNWPPRLDAALQRSRCLVSLLTATYFRSDWCLRELFTFFEREKRTNTQLVIPIVLHKGEVFPDYIKERQQFDMRNFFITASAFSKTEKYIDFESAIRDLVRQVAQVIKKSPPFDLGWENIPVVIPSSSTDKMYPKFPKL